MVQRRTILGGATLVGIAAYFGYPAMRDALAPELSFEPLQSPQGFRRLTNDGQSSSGFDMFVGLDSGADQALDAAVRRVESRICATVFRRYESGKGTVPVASFSDYNCPFCRVLTERLGRIEEKGAIDVTWHELPLLGEPSLIAAKGALAADQQGAYLTFHRALMNSRFQTTPDYLANLAGRLDIDVEQMILDMESERVSELIYESRALARIFGFIGTPAIIVGRTVIQGEISELNLMRLIERERQDGDIANCISVA